jgi:hypothetical protein
MKPIMPASKKWRVSARPRQLERLTDTYLELASRAVCSL